MFAYAILITIKKRLRQERQAGIKKTKYPATTTTTATNATVTSTDADVSAAAAMYYGY